MSYILAAESIRKSFGRNLVLAAAGLWARPGVITALLGRNGSGKTTLVKIACGWLRADSGIVIFREQRLTRPRLAQLAGLGLFYLPDRNLLNPAVSLRRHLAAVKRRFPEADSEAAIEALGVGALLDRKPHSLSVGERRRAELAVGLARNPLCLLADEPFRGLMPRDAEALQSALRRFANAGCAIVVTGHEVEALLGLADDVIWQTSGTTHHLGSRAEAVRHRQFHLEYLAERSYLVSDDFRNGSGREPPRKQADESADQHGAGDADRRGGRVRRDASAD